MGMMDDVKGKMSSMGEDLRARFEELKDKHENGSMTDSEREEYNQIRARLDGRGGE